MKSMKKALTANKVLGSLRKRASGASISPADRQVAPDAPSAHNAAAAASAKNQSPEASANSSVKAFCESGASVQGDEILFLPPIVDAAESSPAAAAECARVIRKYLDKHYYTRPACQYNALMLLRILTDNPGETFTRNLNAEFAETCRKLLKHGRDSRVNQMLMDTLDDFQHTKMYDPNLLPLVDMWKARKEDALRKHGEQPPPNLQRQTLGAPIINPHSQNYFNRSQRAGRLPDPIELASRLEEARTSAKLLEQVVMNTPPGEMFSNELIKEFADRCQSASRSILGYMSCDNPGPDNETMESLIDTNEQLQTALNQHRRAVLNAKKQLGPNEPGAEEPTMTPAANGHRDRVLEWQKTQAQLYASGEQPESPDMPAQPPGNGKGKETETTYNQAGVSGAGPSGSGQRDDGDGPLEDPFRDPQPEESNSRHHYEPFNPGFHSVNGPAGGPVTASGAEAGGAGRVLSRDNESDSEIYDKEPKNKNPVYRF